jgi:hypothetical protein
MANVKISDLTSADPLDGTEEVPILQDGATVAVSVADLQLLLGYATGDRPTAAAAGAGAVIFDSTLGKPIYSDGSDWRLFADDSTA